MTLGLFFSHISLHNDILADIGHGSGPILFVLEIGFEKVTDGLLRKCRQKIEREGEKEREER